jgi:hypothetical protein
VIEIQIWMAPSIRRLPCLFCGGESQKDDVHAVLVEDGARTGFAICEACLGSSADALKARVKARANELALRSELLRTIAQSPVPPSLPTLEELNLYRGAPAPLRREFRRLRGV